jgi:hypothetical protein
MAWGNFLLDVGFNVAPASGGLTKFRFVKLSGNPEEVTVVAAIADDPIGISQYSVTAAEIVKDKGCSCRVWGISECEASGAIPVGARCTLETNGTVSAMVAASGKRIVGKCVGSPAVNAGDRISLLIFQDGALA